MTTLYLIRHGEAVNNIKHIWGGDSELTGKGKRQAREMGGYLKNFEFETLYHSPKKRAVKTAEIIAEIKPGIKLIEIQELTERDYGELEGLTIEETNKKFPGMKPIGGTALYYGKIGGENYEDIRNRVRSFLKMLKSIRSYVGVVGHQMTNRAILGESLDLPIDKIPFITTPNDCIYEINLDNLVVWNIHNGVRKKGIID